LQNTIGRETRRLPGRQGHHGVRSSRLPCRIHDSVSVGISLAKDDTATVFGEDVAFGGVFRCTKVSYASFLRYSILICFALVGFGRRVWWAMRPVSFSPMIQPSCQAGSVSSSRREIYSAIFMEPKILYRSAVEQVPIGNYELPLSRAEVLILCADLTLLTWGTPVYHCEAALSLPTDLPPSLAPLTPEPARPSLSTCALSSHGACQREVPRYSC
jgi:hypothetical protein